MKVPTGATVGLLETGVFLNEAVSLHGSIWQWAVWPVGQSAEHGQAKPRRADGGILQGARVMQEFLVNQFLLQVHMVSQLGVSMRNVVKFA